MSTKQQRKTARRKAKQANNRPKQWEREHFREASQTGFDAAICLSAAAMMVGLKNL